MKKILFAIPKGRIMNDLGKIFAQIGIIPEQEFFDENSRKLVFKTNLESLEIVKVRSFDVATFVKFGVCDIGICGSDVIKEFDSKDIFQVLDLDIARCRLSVAATKKIKISNSLYSHIRVATKYVNISSEFFMKKGIQAEIIKLNGAVEIAPILGLCDVIIDLVDTGKTLEQNNIHEIEKIFDVSSFLIINKGSLKTKNSELNKIIDLFKHSNE